MHTVLVRGVLALALLIIPSMFAVVFLGKADLNPLISLSYLLAIAIAGWLFGLVAGLFVGAAGFLATLHKATA